MCQKQNKTKVKIEDFFFNPPKHSTSEPKSKRIKPFPVTRWKQQNSSPERKNFKIKDF